MCNNIISLTLTQLTQRKFNNALNMVMIRTTWAMVSILMLILLMIYVFVIKFGQDDIKSHPNHFTGTHAARARALEIRGWHTAVVSLVKTVADSCIVSKKAVVHSTDEVVSTVGVDITVSFSFKAAALLGVTA